MADETQKKEVRTVSLRTIAWVFGFVVLLACGVYMLLMLNRIVNHLEKQTDLNKPSSTVNCLVHGNTGKGWAPSRITQDGRQKIDLVIKRVLQSQKMVRPVGTPKNKKR